MSGLRRWLLANARWLLIGCLAAALVAPAVAGVLVVAALWLGGVVTGAALVAAEDKRILRVLVKEIDRLNRINKRICERARRNT